MLLPTCAQFNSICLDRTNLRILGNSLAFQLFIILPSLRLKNKYLPTLESFILSLGK